MFVICIYIIALAISSTDLCMFCLKLLLLLLSSLLLVVVVAVLLLLLLVVVVVVELFHSIFGGAQTMVAQTAVKGIMSYG